MGIDSGSSSTSPSADMRSLPSTGIVVFSTPTLPREDRGIPAQVKIVIPEDEIDQTGVAPQGNDLFSLQLALTHNGVRLYRQWMAHSDAAPLYLAIDGVMISSTPLQAVDEDTIELGGLDFNSIYALAVTLDYDQKSLAALNELDPHTGLQPPEESDESVTTWKITSTGGQFIGDQLDDILEILNNRFEACFNGQVSARRVQSALQAVSPGDVDRDLLARLVATPGQVTIFSSRQRPRKGDALPADAAALLTQDHIQYAGVEDSEHAILVIELNDQGIEILSRYQSQGFTAPLYLALDDLVVAPQYFIISGDSRLEMDDLSTPEAVFLYTIIDNDPLPASLSITPIASNLQDEEMTSTWKVAPNDPTFNNLDDLFIILNNRAGLLYKNDVSVERAQSSLRIVTAPHITSGQVLRLITTLGRASFLATSEPPRVGAALPSSASTILDQSDILSVSLENPINPTLVIELSEQGSGKIIDYTQHNSSQSVYLALDGRFASESPLDIGAPSRVKLSGLPLDEAVFLCAMLDNDPLPTSLSVSPITISRADESYLRGFNDLWLVKPLQDIDLDANDWEDIRSILTFRFETMLKDATSVEFEGGHLTIIPDLHTDLEDLKSLVTLRGQVQIFSAPFPPAPKQPIPQGARPLLTQDDINEVAVEYEEHNILLRIKLNVEGPRLGRDSSQSGSSARFYLAIDGQVVSDLPLTSDGSNALFMDGLSRREASFFAAILDNDILPVALTLEPLALDSYDQFVPESNQTWYVEPADGSSDLSPRQVDQVVSILNERSADLIDGPLTFEANENWGIIVQFPGADTPVNLDTLEQIVTHPGKVSIFSSVNPPEAGEMLAFSAHVQLTEEHILTAEADGSQVPAALKLFLSRPGKTILASLPGKPLFLAVDDQVVSAAPLFRAADDQLVLTGLDFENAKLLAVLMNHDTLPLSLHINMEEDADG